MWMCGWGVVKITPQINDDFLINVNDIMCKQLPRPARKFCKKLLTDIDGSYLPVITVTVELWESV